jgi:hypothetical protein
VIRDGKLLLCPLLRSPEAGPPLGLGWAPPLNLSPAVHQPLGTNQSEREGMGEGRGKSEREGTGAGGGKEAGPPLGLGWAPPLNLSRAAHQPLGYKSLFLPPDSR